MLLKVFINVKWKDKDRIKFINAGKQGKGKRVFVFETDEDIDAIIIKDGIEIESISVLKAKEAIKKHDSKAAHGVIEITGKKKDQH